MRRVLTIAGFTTGIILGVFLLGIFIAAGPPAGRAGRPPRWAGWSPRCASERHWRGPGTRWSARPPPSASACSPAGSGPPAKPRPRPLLRRVLRSGQGRERSPQCGRRCEMIGPAGEQEVFHVPQARLLGRLDGGVPPRRHGGRPALPPGHALREPGSEDGPRRPPWRARRTWPPATDGGPRTIVSPQRSSRTTRCRPTSSSRPAETRPSPGCCGRAPTAPSPGRCACSRSTTRTRPSSASPPRACPTDFRESPPRGRPRGRPRPRGSAPDRGGRRGRQLGRGPHRVRSPRGVAGGPAGRASRPLLRLRAHRGRQAARRGALPPAPGGERGPLHRADPLREDDRRRSIGDSRRCARATTSSRGSVPARSSSSTGVGRSWASSCSCAVAGWSGDRRCPGEVPSRS